eukprot:14221389-Alexandrium_andersonii.AAC.1
MSASLVGSEMCIRDRCVATHGATWARPQQEQLGPEPTRAGPRATVTVSYTHLTLPTICSV